MTKTIAEINDRIRKGQAVVVTAEEVIKVLERVGFSLARQSGSHRIYKNREGKRVTVPYHAGILLRKEGQGTLKATWCGGSWELSLRAWASSRLAFGLRSEANWDLQTKAVCDALD